MESKYQKYYEKLKNKDFNSFISKYNNAIKTVKSKITNVSTSISSNSNSWNEKGVSTIQNTTIPGLQKDVKQVEAGLTALTSAVTKTSTLVSKLEQLESACNAYDNASEEYKSTYRTRINGLEREIDSLITEINSITIVTIVDEKDKKSASEANKNTVNNSSSIAQKKAEFLGDVDDSSQYTRASNYKTMRKIMTAFDNTTGEILTENSTITLKPGETRIITVKLPTNTGMIGELKRTSADGDEGYRSGKVVTAKSDVNPDSNVIDYVNYKSYSQHFPKGVDLHQNHYDWVITANNEGAVTISQTCEYSLKDEPTFYSKVMFELNVRVKS